MVDRCTAADRCTATVFHGADVADCAAPKGADVHPDSPLHRCTNPIGAAVVGAAVVTGLARCLFLPSARGNPTERPSGDMIDPRPQADIIGNHARHNEYYRKYLPEAPGRPETGAFLRVARERGLPRISLAGASVSVVPRPSRP